MQDHDFANWLKTAARSYNEPPPPDVNGMWAEIERQHFAASSSAPVLVAETSSDMSTLSARHAPWWAQTWLRVAAALIVGVGLGRVSFAPTAPAGSVVVASRATPTTDARAAQPPVMLPALSAPEANKYLGETVALLASLQSDTRSARTDKQLIAGASDLLNTTRFLLDSPNSRNPNVRGLLEDLELVLVQIVQLSNDGTADDVNLIHQALEQRDVMPRLRNAVANNYSAE